MFVFSRISKGKVTKSKNCTFSESYIFNPHFVWIFSGIAHVMSDASFLKLMIMIEYIKMMQIPYLSIWSMLLSGKVPHASDSSHLSWLKDPVLVQTLSYIGGK